MVTWKHINREGTELINTVKNYGNSSARINCPRNWIGRKVKVVLLEAPEKQSPDTGSKSQ